MTQPVPISPEDGERRIRLRRLDDCLNVLEQAHELDMTVVNEKIAELVADRVPTIHPGMLIADAIEEVLRHQEPYMLQVRPESPLAGCGGAASPSTSGSCSSGARGMRGEAPRHRARVSAQRSNGRSPVRGGRTLHCPADCMSDFGFDPADLFRKRPPGGRGPRPLRSGPIMPRRRMILIGIAVLLILVIVVALSSSISASSTSSSTTWGTPTSSGRRSWPRSSFSSSASWSPGSWSR